MMTVQLTCKNCGSGIQVYPDTNKNKAQCDVCQTCVQVKFSAKHACSELDDCPECGRKDFYVQKDFNRKLGVLFFIIAAVASIWTYGLSLVALFLVDVFLFKRLSSIVICYNCNAIFRKVSNISDFSDFNHEMNDRIVYSGHDFHGKKLEH